MNPRDPALGSPALPEWVGEFRPHQVVAVDEIVRSFRAGAKVVFLDAPTGAGKTLIAETVRRVLDDSAMYLCTTLSLQTQFLHDYPYAKLIKGRRNYSTYDHPELFERAGVRAVSSADCDKRQALTPVPGCGGCDFGTADLGIMEDIDNEGFRSASHCSFCHPSEKCPYTVAKLEALKAPLSVANSSYFLNEANFVGQLGEQKRKGYSYYNHDLVIVDEADSLEDEIMRFVQFDLPKRLMRSLNLKPPKLKNHPAAWRQWIEEDALPVLKRYRGSIRVTDGDVNARREWNNISKKIGHLDEIKEEIEEGWVYSGYEMGDVSFKPVKVDKVARDQLWRHGKRFLLMSATIISPDQMSEDLGLEPHEWMSVRVPSTFPVANRPIYVRGAASMTARTKEEAWPKMVKAIKEVMDKHPKDRVLVHTVSYALTAFLSEHLDPGRVLSYQNAREREGALELFRKQANAVLLASSFERGIDLPDEECRVIIVAKVPFPYLGDKQVKARMNVKGGQGWYAMQTIRSLVQMTGRGVRHESDYADAYILDSQFLIHIWRKYRGMIPEWWKEALEWQS